ncbi:Z1 domain-containing protein [Stenotrophomonas maltophilia]|uniref:Z1 domain-containing protein n=1 Tax=Stenotrophomonas maltophilia TaxID=40324 RepID=UPI000F6870DD|nr:Z1 domain-containing protein [Stenotrophomonas maltophilia]RRU70676.1 endonuclease [Stenotrophomonas maltophilia]
MSDSSESSVIKIVQELLAAEKDPGPITPTLIDEKISLVLMLNPKWAVDLDRDAVTDELIRRFSVWIGDDISLSDDTDHEPWLDSSRKEDWRYWQRYREMLEKDLSWDIADKLDKSTDKILGMLEDPLRPGQWSRRGLVVGHVQSGKTASYTGLVCKAADAQYKIIIVLAGLHNNLRSQTQIRLEEGFLGYETSSAHDVLKRTGVGLIDSDISIKPNCATTRADNGDFGGRAATQLSISPEQRPWLFVVKKNKSVLVRLLKWIQAHVADAPIQGVESSSTNKKDLPAVAKRATKFPLLIIDDEADNASVDTGEMVVDEEGRADEEHDPTTINKLIRRILNSFSRSAYVGYTATPFANIFIHERGETRNEGADLFPSAFIQNLAAPDNYVGPTAMFGRSSPEGRKGQLPLTRPVGDYQSDDKTTGWMPPGHKIDHVPVWSKEHALPPSLREAVDSFILACAVRKLRGQGKKHSSMLVHVTRFNNVQKVVKADIDGYVKHARQAIGRGIEHTDTLSNLQDLWNRDFLPASATVRELGLGDVPSADATWQDVMSALPGVLDDIEVRMINGTAKDALDYEQNKDRGLKVIAIGGDKLARGLTLEGLCTSYFLRASKMYDTLMQMGRWFGYRPGYLDLCRLYTSPDLIRWFKHISDASAELREEFDLMANSGATPREFGLKVQSHPEMMVTSQIKMRSAKTLHLSYSGELVQTVTFPIDPAVLNRNLNTASRLVAQMGEPSQRETVAAQFDGGVKEWHGHLWKDVPVASVVDFLDGYSTLASAYRVNSKVLAEFIRKMAEGNELTQWSVAVLGTRSGERHELAPGISIGMARRMADTEPTDRYSIGVLLDPTDESIDVSTEQWKAALALSVSTWEKKKQKKSAIPPESPTGVALRHVRGEGATGVKGEPEKGLLILYVLDSGRAGAKEGKDWVRPKFLKNAPPVLAFAVSFPGSSSMIKIPYKVNNVGWESDYSDFSDHVLNNTAGESINAPFQQ